MMEKAGYLQRTGYKAFDSEGNTHDVVELHILSIRYAIRRSDLAKAISAHVFVQVEDLTRNWNYYLGATSGLAHVSASGKAMNIDIFNEGSFTVSLRALGAVMYGKERLAYIMKIPEQVPQPQKTRKVTVDQRHISAVV
jgi:hypothetical protein